MTTLSLITLAGFLAAVVAFAKYKNHKLGKEVEGLDELKAEHHKKVLRERARAMLEDYKRETEDKAAGPKTERASDEASKSSIDKPALKAARAKMMATRKSRRRKKWSIGDKSTALDVIMQRWEPENRSYVVLIPSPLRRVDFAGGEAEVIYEAPGLKEKLASSK